MCITIPFHLNPFSLFCAAIMLIYENSNRQNGIVLSNFESHLCKYLWRKKTFHSNCAYEWHWVTKLHAIMAVASAIPKVYPSVKNNSRKKQMKYTYWIRTTTIATTLDFHWLRFLLFYMVDPLQYNNTFKRSGSWITILNGK